MGLPTRRAKRHLPCGHDDSEMIYFGSRMGCRKDGRKWEWQPAEWREIVKKPSKSEEPSEEGEQQKERGLFSRVLGRKEAVPAQ